MLQSSCSRTQSLNSFINFVIGVLQLGDSIWREASSHFTIAAAPVFFFCSWCIFIILSMSMAVNLLLPTFQNCTCFSCYLKFLVSTDSQLTVILM